MNRAELRDRVSRIVSWRLPTADTDGIADFNACLQDGYNRLVGECPEAVAPDVLRYWTPQQVVGGQGVAASTVISTTADAYVMQFTGGSFSPTTDGTWNGVFTLVVKLGNGLYVRYRVRAFWITIMGGQKYCTLDRPWTHGTLTSNASWWLYPATLWLPPDIIKVQSCQLMGVQGQSLSLQPRLLSNMQYTYPNTSNPSTLTSGTPTYLTRQTQEQIPAPNKAPTLTKVAGPWSGDPPGTFQYCYTLFEGYHDGDLKTPGGSFRVIRESAPSPLSAAMTVGAGDAIQLTFPDVEWEQNFGDSGTLRYGQSGRYRRIYRLRSAVSAGTSGPTNLETPSILQFWQDSTGSVGTVTDNGSILPDYSLRIPQSAGCYAWEVYPVPSTKSEYSLQVLRRPGKLENDQDAPRINDDATDALVLWCAYYVARMDKDPANANDLYQKAEVATALLRANYASPSSRIERPAWDGTPRQTRWPFASERT